VGAGGFSVSALGSFTYGLGDTPERWTYLHDDGQLYKTWLPGGNPATWLESQRLCQQAGGDLVDIPQASHLTSRLVTVLCRHITQRACQPCSAKQCASCVQVSVKPNVRPSSNALDWRPGTAIAQQILQSVPTPSESEPYAWLGAHECNGSASALLLCPMQAGPSIQLAAVLLAWSAHI
jgi:hypothetical protein